MRTVRIVDNGSCSLAGDVVMEHDGQDIAALIRTAIRMRPDRIVIDLSLEGIAAVLIREGGDVI